ncbi:uncharacterized protein LOC143881225 [Tasmannia lanceolata]|uniref:uncharacterized protein LOC143881225 n=1 Tax=Tasmannia lanceolata TaxID=3420 RepID=UPI0040648F4E
MSTTTSLRGNETDRMALLTFKNGIRSDPLNALISWNNTVHFCMWNGVTCSYKHQRVTVLDLSGQNLVGSISPSIFNLTFLREMYLQENNFNGQISQQIGYLFRLRYLNMSFNSLEGEIPSNLSRCMDIQKIDVGNNILTRKIPVELSTLKNLQQLFLGYNFLRGSIPPSLGNLTSLTILFLRSNHLEGTIPYDLARIRSLEIISLSTNNLSDTFPSSLYNLSSLVELAVVENQLSGTLPIDLGISLPRIQIFVLGGNQFTGNFPISLSNASRLQAVELADNHFSGLVPEIFGSLKDLRSLVLSGNQFGIGKANDLSFITSMTNCSNLQSLMLQENRFGGIIPSSIAKLSTHLSWLELGKSPIFGSIPSDIGNLVNLQVLGIYETFIMGFIPSSIGKLHSLQILHISGNRLSGQIPPSVGNITQLNKLYLQGNNLQGSIPLTLGTYQNLLLLSLAENKLHGTIPKQVMGLPSLSIGLNLSGFSFTGPLPLEVGNLKHLAILDVSKNKLSGEIPSTLGNCESLIALYMDTNSFQGTIPPFFSNFKAIEFLGLSQNNFSGRIPTYLESAVLYWLRKSRMKPSSTTSIEGQHLKVSYAELFEATNRFSSANLIGVGSYGTVYKGILGREKNIVAVKSFIAECKALRNIRHRNLVKILTSCSSMNFGGDDFKALVFEYMPNGSLEKWLHPKVDEQHQLRILNFIERLNKAIDVASALDYLHHHCHTPIAHCDLKPSNILLDEEMNGHVGDFGLAKFHSGLIRNSSEDQSSTIGLKRTIGYIAPCNNFVSFFNLLIFK